MDVTHHDSKYPYGNRADPLVGAPTDPPDSYGRAGEIDCGAAIEVRLGFDAQDIAEAQVTGAGPNEAMAAAAALSIMIKGISWRRAASISSQELAGAIRGEHESKTRSAAIAKIEWQLPGADQRRRSRELVAAGFAIEALHRALEDALKNNSFPRAGNIDDRTVLVAMSGGVDSSVACLLEKQRGHNVIGLTMRLWSDPVCEEDTGSSCCSPLSIRDARAVCHLLGLPHLTIDLASDFESKVVAPFVAAHLAGMTPNPCTTCNGVFRFPALRSLAEHLGAGRIATGHYARVTPAPAGPRLIRGADRGKDQSYMLWALEPGLLGRLDFPVGEMTKSQTRALARRASLPTHARPESQDICFIPDGDHRRFLRTRAAASPGPGLIVDSNGRTIGRHTGFTDYTVGQRRGLGGGASEPLFVLGTRPDDNVVIAGTHDQLATKHLVINDVNYFSSAKTLKDTSGLSLQVRYRSAAVAAHVTGKHENYLEIEALEPLFGVAPGQSAVLYKEDEVMAAGVIVRP